MKGQTKKFTVRVSAQAVTALENFQAQYPSRSISEFMNGAVLYLAKQSRVGGLDAACEPLIGAGQENLMRAIAAEAVAAYYTKEDKRARPPVRPRLVLV